MTLKDSTVQKLDEIAKRLGKSGQETVLYLCILFNEEHPENNIVETEQEITS